MDQSYFLLEGAARCRLATALQKVAINGGLVRLCPLRQACGAFSPLLE